MAQRRVALSTRRWLSGLLASAALFAVASGLVALLAPYVPDLLGLPPLYLLAVVPVAMRWGIGPGVAVAVASCAVFALVFVPLYLGAQFEVPSLSSLGVFLVSALLVGYLAARAHREALDLGRLSREQAALRRVATLVAESARPSAVFAAVTREVGMLSGADLARIERYEADGTVTTVATWSRVPQRWAVGTRLPLDGLSIAQQIRETGEAARIHSYADATGAIAREAQQLGIRSAVGFPIIVEGRLWGAIKAGVTCDEPFPAGTESRMAQFTELVATAIGNAESLAELAASRARIVAAADETRRRIEQDLHDGAQQRLVSLGLELRLTESRVPEELSELRAEIGRNADDLSAVVDELRELARGIHPAILAEGGLAPALRTLVRRSSVPVELDIATAARFPRPVELAAYYVVSEALTNATKHANGSYVSVSLAEREGVLELSVRDDGVGGADPRGSGLIGLRDRVEALGGTIEVTSPRGAGTTVLVRFPTDAGRLITVSPGPAGG
jgi:signal transduction histidine kinase